MPRKQLLRQSREDKTLNKGNIKCHEKKGKAKKHNSIQKETPYMNSSRGILIFCYKIQKLTDS